MLICNNCDNVLLTDSYDDYIPYCPECINHDHPEQIEMVLVWWADWLVARREESNLVSSAIKTMLELYE